MNLFTWLTKSNQSVVLLCINILCQLIGFLVKDYVLIFQDFHSKRFTTLTDHFWCIFVTFSRVGIFVTFCWFSVETMSRWRRLIIATFQQTCPNPFEDTRAQNIERAASAIQLWGWRPQCDQIGLFFIFLAKKLSYKSSQNIW